MIEVRIERPEDAAAIEQLHTRAFGGPAEAKLGRLITERKKTLISLVALSEGRVVGHILRHYRDMLERHVLEEDRNRTIARQLSGYTSGLRKKYAPVSYTDALKRQQIREYGYNDTVPHDYEEDHLISLELGGHPNDPRNLWPEFPHSPNAKDKVEDQLHQKGCFRHLLLVSYR